MPRYLQLIGIECILKYIGLPVSIHISVYTSDMVFIFIFLILASSMGMLTTPYESNIATLRRDRLRLEEERLLELKKLEEIEKLRPPREKW